jgi:ParB family chromosome partitioning protein
VPDVQRIEIAKIGAMSHLRAPRAARIEAIRAAIEREGQREPIEVSPAGNGLFALAHGLVRIEALKLLGATEVLAVVRKATADERRRREIDANLLQEGCTLLERARYLAARKDLYERDHPDVQHGGARRGAFQVAKFGNLKFSAWAAAAYGVNERTIQRLTKIGADLDSGAAALLSSTEWADAQSALEQISRLEAGLQIEVAGLLSRHTDPVATVAEAIAIAAGRPADNQPAKGWSSFIGGWGRMGARERREALREIAQDLPTGVRIVFEDELADA